MKSVGEAMAIGRTFPESLQKALRSLETGLTGLDEIEIEGLGKGDDANAMRAAIGKPTPDRLLKIAQALRFGMGVAEIHEVTRIDPWFLERLADIVALEEKVRRHGLPRDAVNLRLLKAAGFSDARLAALAAIEESEVAEARAMPGSRRSTSGSTLAPPNSPRRRLHVFDLRGAVRGRPRLRSASLATRQGRHSRRWAEPHRAGHRIRLLLLPCIPV